MAVRAAAAAAAAVTFRKIPAKSLFVSEPDPSWFGNGRNERGNPAWSNPNWLKSRFHFNFAEHHSGSSGFGVVRVLNDDLVQPDRGFGTHPHANMEIVTYVISGNLSHADSMGTRETLGRGSVQFMTAGTGVRHSEHNLDKQTPLHFFQIWINPRKHGLKPNYGSFVGKPDESTGKLALLVSDVLRGDEPAPVKINQDVRIYATILTSDEPVTYTLPPGRQAYMAVAEGSVAVAGKHGDELLETGDAAHVFAENQLRLTRGPGVEQGHVVVIEMASV